MYVIVCTNVDSVTVACIFLSSPGDAGQPDLEDRRSQGQVGGEGDAGPGQQQARPHGVWPQPSGTLDATATLYSYNLLQVLNTLKHFELFYKIGGRKLKCCHSNTLLQTYCIHVWIKKSIS